MNRKFPIYENKHLHKENDKCENYLSSFGYKLNRQGFDTICVL